MTHTERLKAAIIGGDVQTVRESLSRRQVSDTFKDGRTLLHVACQNGKVEIVELFLQHGSRVGARDVNGYTPLHLAAAQGHKEVIKALLEFEAQVDDQDQFGNTSVHMAAWNGFSQSIKLLVQFHANINIQNKVGFTALHTAAQRGHNQSARELLYADAQVDAKNKYGETPLHTSTRHGHAGVTQILINANSNLNSKNKEGESCLHVAAVLQRTKIARLLVEAGAKMSQKNKKGETPLDVACKNNSPEIVNLLQDASVGGRRRRKGLFSFLRRKTTPSNSSREQVLSLDPSLPSSVGSNKNIDQTQGLSRTESFGEIRPERTGQDFSSLDRLGTRRRQRDEEMQTQDVRRPPRQHLPTWNELVERSTGDNPPNLGGADYENFDPMRAAPWGGYNLWHSSPGIVGAHGYSHVALYPQAYGFVPGYEACGGPPVAGMMPPYHVDVRNRPGPSHGGLTNTIEQSMQYYRDLAGNLKQGPASMNPACSGPTPSNQARGLFSPGNYNFLFDVDADQFLHRGADIPAHHLYEPIGIRGPDEPPSDDDDLWRAMEQARRHHRSPGQHRSPPFSGTRRDVNAFPLEPRVFIRNLGASRAQGAGDEIPAANRNYYPNHPVAERLPGSRRRDNFDSERSRERSWQRTIGRPGLAGGRRPSHAQLPRRSHSEETLSSVMGSSHERRRAEQRFASRFRSDNLREGRGRNHRSNTIESGAMTSRRGVRNFPSEIAHHPGATYRSHLRTEPRRNGNRSPEGAVAMTASLREKSKNLDLEEDYRSESSGHEEDNGETNVDPDRSLRSSEDDNDGREELLPLDDLVAGTANFNLEELEASPRKRHSPENSSPSEMPGSRNGTSPQPPVETRRQCGDEMEYFRRDLGDIDTSSLEFETSLDNAEVPPLRWERPKSSGVNPTTRPTSIKPGLESPPGRTGRAAGKRKPRASKRSDGSPFDVNRVTSV